MGSATALAAIAATRATTVGDVANEQSLLGLFRLHDNNLEEDLCKHGQGGKPRAMRQPNATTARPRMLSR